MFILNKDCNDVYNTDHIVNIYQDECTIKVCAGTATRGGVLGKYNKYSVTAYAYNAGSAKTTISHDCDVLIVGECD